MGRHVSPLPYVFLTADLLQFHSLAPRHTLSNALWFGGVFAALGIISRDEEQGAKIGVILAIALLIYSTSNATEWQGELDFSTIFGFVILFFFIVLFGWLGSLFGAAAAALYAYSLKIEEASAIHREDDEETLAYLKRSLLVGAGVNGILIAIAVVIWLKNMVTTWLI